MSFFSNADINRLAVHSTLHQLGFGIAGAFISAFLLRAGLPPAQVFLAFAGVLGLRFALRPLVLVVVPILGARRTLVLGTLLFALQYPPLARVEGIGPALFLWIVVAALGQVFYWTCYHAFFAALRDRAARGRQLGMRQALLALANIAGPAAGAPCSPLSVPARPSQARLCRPLLTRFGLCQRPSCRMPECWRSVTRGLVGWHFFFRNRRPTTSRPNSPGRDDASRSRRRSALRRQGRPQRRRSRQHF
jgi:MFS family permease